MRERRVRLIGLLAVCVLAAGCAVPGSVGGYLHNRRHDLIDLFHVDFTAVSVGAIAYAGPLIVGANYMTGVRPREPSATLQLGLGGPRLLGRKGLATGLLWPYSYWNDDRHLYGERPKRAPSGLSAGAAVGAVPGVAAEVDALELIDFVAGLCCLDLLEDDPDIGEEPESPPDDGLR